MNLIKIYCLLFCICFNNIYEIDGANEVCYSYLGCFSMSYPWYSWFRPLPAPLSPDVIATGFYLYTRNHPERYYVTKLPNITLDGSDYDGTRPTFFITHGFVHDANQTWLSDMKDALLKKLNANVFLVDWGQGADNANYFQVAANIRVVAAEVIRLCKFLIDTTGSNVSTWHFIGHSLGAHTFSYVAKSIPGIAQLTALDPAQPAFEGYNKDVRLDATDALFVEVIHTNARPFIPFAGLGMIGPYGNVDFYMNGGLDQPGCLTPPAKLFTFRDLTSASQLKELVYYVGCPHMRSYIYFTSSIKDNCTFWGRRTEDLVTNRVCGPTTCSPLGLDTVNYPARGAFQITTKSLDPFCLSNTEVDINMAKFRNALALKPAEEDSKEESTPTTLLSEEHFSTNRNAKYCKMNKNINGKYKCECEGDYILRYFICLFGSVDERRFEACCMH